jgi:pseudaminic acid cytidylyltransferase
MIPELASTLVILPARGGSKRIPNKNIIEIYGEPMIYWPLKVLRNLFSAEKVLVSTDSEKVKAILEKKGLSVPFKRPAHLSNDKIGTFEVIKHALEWYERNVIHVDFVLTVYPTAVMLSEIDICEAISMLVKDKECDSIMTATNFPSPIQRAFFKNSNGYAQMFEPKYYSSRSQDLVMSMQDAGQFYLSRVESIRAGKILTNSNVKIHLLNRNKVVNIDTLEDFEIAEEKLRLSKDKYLDDNWSF